MPARGLDKTADIYRQFVFGVSLGLEFITGHTAFHENLEFLHTGVNSSIIFK